MAKSLKLVKVDECPFMFSLMNDYYFDGYNDGHDGKYMPIIPPTPEKEQLELCIRASSKIYWEFMDEYKKTYGEEFNG